MIHTLRGARLRAEAMKLPASLTSRLVLTAVSLVALVSLLVGITTTLAMRNYLFDQLDQDVSAELGRASAARGRTARPPANGPDDDGTASRTSRGRASAP